MAYVLVIEDDEQTASLLNSLITSLNHQVSRVPTADRGIDMLSSNHDVNLILMDMRLPGMKGWEAARLIKDNPNLSHIPIFAVTVEISPEDRQKAYDAGCDEFIAKPFNIRELCNIIEQYLS